MLAATALQRIHQISIRTQDTARAVAFYRDALGLKLLFQAPPTLAFFECGGVRLMLSPAEPEFDHQGSVIYFAVDDINATHAALTAAGVTFRSEPHMIAKLPDREVWLADFMDSEGNVLAVMSEPRR
jgi:predicted enzyme related to lactoylglutathione lyase